MNEKFYLLDYNSYKVFESLIESPKTISGILGTKTGFKKEGYKWYVSPECQRTYKLLLKLEENNWIYRVKVKKNVYWHINKRGKLLYMVQKLLRGYPDEYKFEDIALSFDIKTRKKLIENYRKILRLLSEAKVKINSHEDDFASVMEYSKKVFNEIYAIVQEMNVFPKKILGVNIMEYKVYNTPHAYVLLRVEPGTIERLFSKFKTLNFIEWGGLLTGPYDIALRVWAKDSKEFYNHINKLKSFEGVIDIRTDFIHSELPEFNGFHKPVSGLLKVYVKGGIEPDAFMHKLENLDGLVNISWIAGDTDFLIGLEANSTKDLTTNILKNLLSIKDIRRTETYILGDSFLLKR